MLHPDKFYRTWERLPDGGHRCVVHKLAMRVLGANIVDQPDGSEDRNVNKNSDRFRAGRLGNLLTREYDTIAELLPVFERNRQLTALLEALTELRKRGFEPSIELRNGAQATARHLAGRRPLSVAERLRVHSL